MHAGWGNLTHNTCEGHPTTPSSRKTRRENRSAQKARNNGIRAGSPVASQVAREKKTDQNQMQAMQSSPSGRGSSLHPLTCYQQSAPWLTVSAGSQYDHYNDQDHGYNLNHGSYHPVMQPSLPQMVEEHSYGHANAYLLRCITIKDRHRLGISHLRSIITIPDHSQRYPT